MFAICSGNIQNQRKVVPVSKDKKVVGVGMAGLDFIAKVATFPEPDQKLRTLDSSIQGGGNAANTLTCLRRLGIEVILVTKIGDDISGQSILEEFEREGMDTSFIIRQEETQSAFTYVIVDVSTSTRTCIHTPSKAELTSEEVNVSCLNGASLLHLDGRHPSAALKIAQHARDKGIPIVLDVERRREGLENLLCLADYIITNAEFPSEYFGQLNRLNGLEKLLDAYPARWVISTLGKEGCVMMSRLDSDREEKTANLSHFPIMAVKTTFPLPTPCRECLPKYRLIDCPCWPVERVVDTTGAGDAFIGGIIYAILHHFDQEHMLYFASRVAAEKLSALGARKGLVYIDHLESWIATNVKERNT
ncbi:Ketohexokinase [Galdieria sulphuraria]|nr:Ketohexokinase [Galdieria sulphuraria]